MPHPWRADCRIGFSIGAARVTCGEYPPKQAMAEIRGESKTRSNTILTAVPKTQVLAISATKGRNPVFDKKTPRKGLKSTCHLYDKLARVPEYSGGASCIKPVNASITEVCLLIGATCGSPSPFESICGWRRRPFSRKNWQTF